MGPAVAETGNPCRNCTEVLYCALDYCPFCGTATASEPMVVGEQASAALLPDYARTLLAEASAYEEDLKRERDEQRDLHHAARRQVSRLEAEIRQLTGQLADTVKRISDQDVRINELQSERETQADEARRKDRELERLRRRAGGKLWTLLLGAVIGALLVAVASYLRPAAAPVHASVPLDMQWQSLDLPAGHVTLSADAPFRLRIDGLIYAVPLGESLRLPLAGSNVEARAVEGMAQLEMLSRATG